MTILLLLNAQTGDGNERRDGIDATWYDDGSSCKRRDGRPKRRSGSDGGSMSKEKSTFITTGPKTFLYTLSNIIIIKFYFLSFLLIVLQFFPAFEMRLTNKLSAA